MNSISEYMNENLGDMVFELKGQTYLNAAKKAKRLGDLRSIKFLQAYKDNIDKEFADSEGPSKDDDKFAIYYNADKKGIQRLKGLAKNERGGAHFTENSYGTYLDIQNDELKFAAMIYVAGNKDGDRQCFLRQSLVKQGSWEKVAKKFQKLADRVNNIKAMKPFTYVQLFNDDASVDFFYLIDDDAVLPMSLRTDEGSWYDDACQDHYDEGVKTSINAICKAINQNHKDI